MNQSLRIALGGFRHETNTFSSLRTGDDDFHIIRDAEVLCRRFAQTEMLEGTCLLPTLIASALPGGLVRQATYLRIREELLSRLQAFLPVDGVCFDLHGAMEVEGLGDGEADLLTAVRELVGPQAVISLGLDLHGNITPEMARCVNLITGYRTTPHRDHAQTLQRALSRLIGALRNRQRPTVAFVKLPLIMPGEAAMTEAEPARSLYNGLAHLEQRPGLIDASFFVGYAWSDRPYASASVAVTAEYDSNLATAAAHSFASLVWAQRHDFGLVGEVHGVDEAIQQAVTSRVAPVFLSDAGDNLTAGGAGDIPLLTARLLARGAKGALVAGLVDAEAVQACLRAGEGATVSLSLGGKLDRVNGFPLPVTALVERLVVDREAGAAGHMAAFIRVEGVRIILTSRRRAFTSRDAIAQVGADPMQQRIVVVKLGYLYPDLLDHAPRSILVLSPGVARLDIENLPFAQLGRPIFPLDLHCQWQTPPLADVWIKEADV